MPKKIIYADDAIDAVTSSVMELDGMYIQDLNGRIREAIEQLPSAEPQLDTCPIYGGMCGYPSNLCYECPRHEGAKEQPQWWTEGLQPFAQPVRKTGQWIRRKKGAIGYNCSCCGKSDISNHFDYCPNCGADMRGEDDE